MSDISVRLAEPTTEDIDAVAGLLVAIDNHYGVDPTPPLAAQIRHVEQRMLGLGSSTYVGLGHFEGAPSGLALFAPVHMGVDRGGIVFLKDLFVMPNARRKGLGRALMSLIASVGADLGCSRIDFSVHPENAAARALYDRLGGTGDPDRMYYLIGGDALEALANDP